jgi:hypothetical protein
MILIGADPEFFTADKDGRVRPAHALDVPHKTSPLRDKASEPPNWHIYRDGYAVEFAPRPQDCRERLVGYMNEAMLALKARGQVAKLIATPTVLIDLKDITEGPMDLQSFGCEPAFSAYHGGAPIDIHVDARTYPFRHVGGHMHFCIGNKNYPFGPVGKAVFARLESGDELYKVRAEVCQLTKLMDCFVEMTHTYLHGDLLEKQRRLHYGKAGEFRLQNYGTGFWGLEYRTPSARAFVAEPVVSLLYGLGRAVMDLPASWEPAVLKSWEARAESAANAIQEGDRVAAEKFIEACLITSSPYRNMGVDLAKLSRLRTWLDKRGDEVLYQGHRQIPGNFNGITPFYYGWANFNVSMDREAMFEGAQKKVPLRKAA